MPHSAPSDRTRLRRAHHKGSFDLATIQDILDAMPVAHIGHIIDGAPVVTPTLQWRDGQHVYWHGSSASRLMRKAAGAQVSLTVTLIDAMVMARSGMEHSVNYRSVMVFGQATAIKDPAAKAHSLQVMFDKLFPGRWESLRPMTDSEIKATAILSLPISEASAKLSVGQVQDQQADLDWPAWSGLIPVGLSTGQPIPDPLNQSGLPIPEGLLRWRFGHKP